MHHRILVALTSFQTSFSHPQQVRYCNGISVPAMLQLYYTSLYYLPFQFMYYISIYLKDIIRRYIFSIYLHIFAYIFFIYLTYIFHIFKIYFHIFKICFRILSIYLLYYFKEIYLIPVCY